MKTNTQAPATRSGLKVLAFLALVVASSTANAQFGLPRVPGGGGDAATPANASPVMSKDDFVNSLNERGLSVASARIALIEAQILFNQALGLKEEENIKLSEARAALAAATSGKEVAAALATHSIASAETIAAMDLANAEGRELNAESKATFLLGMARYVQGTVLLKGEVEQLLNLVNEGKRVIDSGNRMQQVALAAAVKPAIDMARTVPGDVATVLGLLPKVVAFAQRQQITIPDDQQNMLNLLGPTPSE